MHRLSLLAIMFVLAFCGPISGAIVYSGSQNVTLQLKGGMSPPPEKAMISIAGSSEKWDDFTIVLEYEMAMPGMTMGRTRLTILGSMGIGMAMGEVVGRDVMAMGTALNLAPGALIGPKSPIADHGLAVLLSEGMAGQIVNGEFGESGGYIGLVLPGSSYYAWLRLSSMSNVGEPIQRVTFPGWAYEDVAGNPIGAGDTGPAPAQCAPRADGQDCEPVTCPSPNDKCVPTKIRVDYNATPPRYTVLECRCLPRDTCHVAIDPPAYVYCAGGCPAGTAQKCYLYATDNGDGTVDYECACGTQPQPPQACCFPDGTCQNLSPANCILQGGWPKGPGTICLGDKNGNRVDDACEQQPTECAPTADGKACLQVTCPNTGEQCVPTKIRVRYTPGAPPAYTVLSCACQSPNLCHVAISSSGSVYCTGGCPANQQCELYATNNADGTIDYECRCTGQPQPTEACCLPDGTCIDVDRQTCLGRGGIPQGPGTNCNTVLCPQPTEACCLPDGTCIDTTANDCRAKGGTPQGPGTNCGSAICPQPTEACCLPDGTCQDLTPAACADKGGVPQGPGTDCGSAVCPPGECDWNEGDPYKMHWPQLPDLSPTGVAFALHPISGYADDFLCTATGPILDIHIWGAFRSDIVPTAGPGSLTLELAIYSNVPADADKPYSRPGTRLWARRFGPGEYTARLVSAWGSLTGHEGEQDWWENALFGEYLKANHKQTYQYNFCIEEEPFTQKQGSIYWLEVKDIRPDNANYKFGWKSTAFELRWNDDAVWQHGDVSHPQTYPSGHRYQGQTLDFAFVITGEEVPECDWEEGDPHKMHWPQTPDLSDKGVDVDMFWATLADDFKCTSAGPIADIHFWGSFADDILPPGGPGNLTFKIAIHTDIPATTAKPWSTPGEPLWTRTFEPGQYTVRQVHEGPEGWYDPATKFYQPNNHKVAYQYNFCIDIEPFVQQQGKIYWLAIKDIAPANAGYTFGWKTTTRRLRWNDDAVYIDSAGLGWLPMTYPDGHAYNGETLDLAFVITGGKELRPLHELGDAPDSSNSFGVAMTAYPKGGPPGVQANFPTVYAAGSPPHGPIHLQPRAVAYLGNGVSLENEADIGPDEDGTNNIVPPNDSPDLDKADDGVQMPLALPHCQQTRFKYTVTVVPVATIEPPPLYVNVWFDWNRDGDWNDTLTCPDGTLVPEWAVQNQLLQFVTSATYDVTTPAFTCWHPPGTTAENPIWMRITLSERQWGMVVSAFRAGGDGPAAGYEFGETEDYYFVPELPGPPQYDFGDAPDSVDAPGYPTLLVHDGARHLIGGPWLDAAGKPDAEADGQPDPGALGDDNNGNDDEDGVFIPPLIRGHTAHIMVRVHGGGVLQAWIDFDHDQNWQSEEVYNGFLPDGLHRIAVPVPSTAATNGTFARFRISTNGGLRSTGLAPDGEVEDHHVLVVDPPPDTEWPQWPDPTPSGMDIRIDSSDGKIRTLADDFKCTSYKKITDVHLWGSWKNDKKGRIRKLVIAIHSDDPPGTLGTDPQNRYSQPDQQALWTKEFGPGQFTETLYWVVPEPGEWWWDPATGELIRGGDRQIWRIDIDIDPAEAFLQVGSSSSPVIYWLVVRAETEGGEFGWKTRQWPDHYMDDAVWDVGSEMPRLWKELRYPKGHPYSGLEKDSIDMAFVITGREEPTPPKPAAEHLKWSQPPIEWDPKSKTPLYCGWDEPSFVIRPSTPVAVPPTVWQIVADDFRCIGNMPVTSVHWWGSYAGWYRPEPPDTKPIAWRIGFWSNVPANPLAKPGHSFPKKLLWRVDVPADRVHEEWAGVDRFQNKSSDSCFQYYVQLKPQEYFWQQKYIDSTTGDDIFWISITAIYPPILIPFNTWGWKTRPQHWMDDAVEFVVEGDLPVGYANDFPLIFTPLEALLCGQQESLDMAFELDTDPNYIKWEQPYTGIRDWPHYEDEESLAIETTTGIKWTQKPDLAETGMDVDATDDLPPTWPPQMLADDFKCTTTGPITHIRIWGSWYGDILPALYPQDVVFRLNIHEDIPADKSLTGYSMPGKVLWRREFKTGQFEGTKYAENLKEGWFVPCKPVYEPSADTVCWQFDFDIDPSEALTQQEGTIYWLAVQAQLVHAPGSEATRFGWKTSAEHWNDDAVWQTEVMPISRPWGELRYPEMHPLKGKSVDLAFEIGGQTQNEQLQTRRLIADDWLCSRETPLTAIVWWGSYIGYRYRACQCQQMAPPLKPDYFLLSIWTDVRSTANVPFSHPGEKIWEYKADSYDEVLVGYDKRPQVVQPGQSAGYEPVFRYSVRLPREKWFCQKNVNDVYWLSVVAVYKNLQEVRYPWGWTNHKCTTWELADTTVLHWKLDETEGLVARDDSGNNNHGTLVGDAKWAACCGRACGALDLDGDGDYVKVDTPTGLNFAPGSFSTSAWIRAREVTGGWRTIMEYDRDGSERNRFGMWLTEDARFHFRVGWNAWQTNQKLNADQWYMLTGTYDSKTKKFSMYVNGQFDIAADLQKGFASANVAKLTVGVRGSEDGEYFNGLIDDVRIYNYALSADQVKALYNASRNDDAVAGHMVIDPAGDRPSPTLVVWEELHDQVGMSEDMSFMLFTEPGCFPCTYSTYADWLALGKPNCWCAPPDGSGYQCDGDADGVTSGFPFNYRVFTGDLTLIVNNWKKKIDDPGLNPCADIDHKDSGFPFKYRVFTGDLSRLVANWKKKDAQLPGDCPRPQ